MINFRVVCVVLICAIVAAELPHPLSDEFITLINSKNTTWTAGRNFREDIPFNYIKNLMGALKDENCLIQLPENSPRPDVIDKLPKNFDARNKWSNCPSLLEIRDQGACRSCWAVAAVAAMTDRVCIYSNGTESFHFSTNDLLSCCDDCGAGCYGGYSCEAWKYWEKHGIVSGGRYESSQGCQPYEVEPCHHSGRTYRYHNNITKPCNHLEITPKCNEVCQKEYAYCYNEDKRFGKTAYRAVGENQIKAEIYLNGSVQADFDVYSDLMLYKSGIYKHEVGDKIGYHSAKIIGWGEENGTKYWLIANSWNTDWGEDGFFKIIRGINHCGIECCVVAGEPKLRIGT